MTLSPRTTAVGALTVLALAGASAFLVGYLRERTFASKIRDLQNALALQSRTTEIDAGVFERLSVRTHELQGFLDGGTVEIDRLRSQLKERDQRLLAVDKLVVKWRKDLTGEAHAQQTISPEGHGSARVDFTEDFGYIGVEGYTLTDPPYAWVRVQQKRPLTLTLAVSQGSDGSWRSSVSSSEENVQVDIALSAVDPYILEPRWYERIGVDVALGVSPWGVLAGIGPSLQLGRATVGPMLWISSDVPRYYGLNVSWRPFQK